MISFEISKFGTRAILNTAWSADVDKVIMELRPEELELNTSKGWNGSNLEFLERYKWITSILLIDHNIKDISGIHELNKIVNIDINTYFETKIDFSRFPNLRSFSLEWRGGSESIFNSINLVELFLNNYKGVSSSPFGNLVNLEFLTILNSPLSELSGVSGLSKLRSLRLGRLRALKSLQGIESMSALERFEMQYCEKVTSLLPLAMLKNLSEINISNNNNIETIAPLGNLYNLRSLLFYGSTNILDGNIEFLKNLPSLSNLSFQNRRHYNSKREQFAQFRG